MNNMHPKEYLLKKLAQSMFYEEIYPKLILSKAPYFDLAWSTFSVVASIDIIRDIFETKYSCTILYR